MPKDLTRQAAHTARRSRRSVMHPGRLDKGQLKYKLRTTLEERSALA